jgi:3-isopropylmalate dehydrogenase
MSYKIALLAGDGIGPEVMQEAVKVIEVISQKYDLEFELEEALVGGAAIDETGEPLPSATIKTCEASDAILFGSVGGPKWDHLPQEKRPEVGALLPLRKHFNFFANIRPAGVSPLLAANSPLKSAIIKDGFSFTIIRELTGGIYFGDKGGDLVNEGWDLMKYERSEVERIARLAFKTALNSRGKVTNVDKANVLKTSALWRQVVREIHQNEFSEVELDHLYIDNATMQVLINPHQFDVILTGNMFGDILSDQSAQISGSIGMQASASLNEDQFGLYEPMGGSAPDIAGLGIANPIAQIACVGLMLKYSFARADIAADLTMAIDEVLKTHRTGDIQTKGLKMVGTKEMGDLIANNLKQI